MIFLGGDIFDFIYQHRCLPSSISIGIASLCFPVLRLFIQERPEFTYALRSKGEDHFKDMTKTEHIANQFGESKLN